MLAAGLVASRFIHFAAVLTLFGVSLFPLYAGTGARAPGAWMRTAMVWASVLALLSGLGWFVFTTASMAGSLAGVTDPATLKSVVLETAFGPLWLARLALAIILVLLTTASGRRTWPGWLVPALAGLLAASLAGTGHAQLGEGWAGLFHVGADGAHLIAAGFWIGGLAALGPVIAAMNRADAAPPDLGRILHRFSGVGYVAVAVLVASGLANSLFLVASPRALIATLYGRLLIAKVALFLAMACLALANRFWITPRLDQSESPDRVWLRRLGRQVALEQGLGIAVIAIVSLLGTLEPAVGD